MPEFNFPQAFTAQSNSTGFSQESISTAWLNKGSASTRDDRFYITFDTDDASYQIYLTDFDDQGTFYASTSSRSILGFPASAEGGFERSLNIISGYGYGASFDIYDAYSGVRLIDNYYATDSNANGVYFTPGAQLGLTGNTLTLRAPRPSSSYSQQVGTSDISILTNGEFSYLRSGSSLSSWAGGRNSSTPYSFTLTGRAKPRNGQLFVPLGNLNEATNIAINLSGSYSGTGTFSISNPDQTGNTSLKNGKYGSLTVDSLTGAFNYTPDQTKIKPLKTGETGVDEFTITLTAANGTVSTATYRVDIIGDTGSDNGGGGDDKPKNKSISITGSRASVSGKPGILIDGLTENFETGSTVKPYLRFPGQTSYTEGTARPTVNANGDFSWQRKTGKKTYVYFTSDDGSVTSNRVIIPAGGAALASSSLKAFDSDPIVGGSSNQHAGHSKGKRRRPVAPAASFGNRLSEDTNSSLLMATDSADTSFYKQHDLVAASSGNW